MNHSILNSALWAAYGDAVGFITEMTDRRSLRRRIGSDQVTKTLPWTRLVGGKFGALAELPAGTYSDDTQLRLATSRSIDSTGHFDVEAFAKIELPVWLSYSLGAGVGSKAAANNLTKPNVTWFSNFYNEGRAQYLDSGGNGAAMRIQPLVWIARGQPVDGRWLQDVMRNTICTHGNPRGIAGALFHSLCLKWVVEKESIPSPRNWRDFCDLIADSPKLIFDDSELNAFWLPTWQSRTGTSLVDGMAEVARECWADIRALEEVLDSNSREKFREMVHKIDAGQPATRGSGTKTAILAAAQSWMNRDLRTPEDALIEVVNVLECDTDSIATMIGAILGYITDEAPKAPLQDAEYIAFEAKRLSSVLGRGNTKSYPYPDLLRWNPPKTQIDAVSLVGANLEISGLGIAEPVSKFYQAKSGEAVWQWLHLEFGQTVLAKMRGSLATHGSPKVEGSARLAEHRSEQSTLFAEKEANTRSLKSLNDLTAQAISSGFNAHSIGTHLLELMERQDGIELAIGYVAIVSKALLVRRGAKVGR